jgi:uncharacterized iron-regulated protein
MNVCFFDLFTGGKLDWDSVLSRVEKHRVIYVGEIHDLKASHELQMKVIDALVGRGYKVAVALEMFQQNYQKFLDEYTAGNLSEVEMLYLTEWHKNWGMDISLYRDIWKYAREKKLKLLAINIPTEFRKKVRDMTYSQMRKTQYLPPDLREPDEGYIKYFRKVLGDHKGLDKDFDRMLRVMIAWDEGMAFSISKFLKENPEYKVVVVVGYGHIYGRFGIPSRVERMTGERGFVFVPLLNIKEDLGNGDVGYCF